MRTLWWIFLNAVVFAILIFLDIWLSSNKHVYERNCSKNGTKEYIASENICVCKSGWETAIDQNPANRVYCNLYVGSSTNNSTGGSASSSFTTTEYSVIIIIVIVLIIGVCVCCCCRRPLMQCMQDCCCGCADGFSLSSGGAQSRNCKSCNLHHHAEIPFYPQFSHQQVSHPSCSLLQSAANPIYIQHPPSIWIPPSSTTAACQHRSPIALSNPNRLSFQDKIVTPIFHATPAPQKKWKSHNKETFDDTLPVTVSPIQDMSRVIVMPSYNEVTSPEAENQITIPSQVFASPETHIRHSSRRKDRRSRKYRQRDVQN